MCDASLNIINGALVSLTVTALLLISPVPTVNAFIACQIQINSVNYAPNAGLGQTVDVTTNLTVTCTTSAIDISGRVDVNDVAANRTISSYPIHVGFVSGPQKTADFTAANSIQAPTAPTIWKLQVRAWLSAGGDIVGDVSKQIQIQVGEALQTAVTTGSETPTELLTTTTAGGSQPFGNLAIAGGIVAAIIVASLLVMMRRKKPSGRVDSVQAQTRQAVVQEVSRPKVVAPTSRVISTGYSDLDNVLAGGLPVGYGILIVSPPCDEKDLLNRRLIESGLAAGAAVFYVSRDLGRSQDLADRYPDNFYVFCPQADKIQPPRKNILKISPVQNLNDLNISMMKSMEVLGHENTSSKILIMDLLSDILLEHGALTTRKWLDDFLAKRKAEGFTILGALNPMIASKQETQTIIDMFDGIIEIYEKEIRERSRRFLIVKKMYGRKYVETELMLDKDKLF